MAAAAARCVAASAVSAAGSKGGARAHDSPPSVPLQRIQPPQKDGNAAEAAKEKELRAEGLKRTAYVNVGRRGVTPEVIAAVREHWRNTRVAKLRCNATSATTDMKRVALELEERSGGRVVHRAGGTVLLYRGDTYEPGPAPSTFDHIPTQALREVLTHTDRGDALVFAHVIAAIEEAYDFHPVAFAVGVGEESERVHNEPGSNVGSCKVLYLGKLLGLSKRKTTRLYGEHLRHVLDTPNGDDHPNLRAFLRHGWDAVEFGGVALTPKVQQQNQEV